MEKFYALITVLLLGLFTSTAAISGGHTGVCQAKPHAQHAHYARHDWHPAVRDMTDISYKNASDATQQRWKTGLFMDDQRRTWMRGGRRDDGSNYWYLGIGCTEYDFSVSCERFNPLR